MTPTPADIRTLRRAHGLTQARAAALIHATTRAWEAWEQGERPMHPAYWELFRRKLEAAHDAP